MTLYVWKSHNPAPLRSYLGLKESVFVCSLHLEGVTVNGCNPSCYCMWNWPF